MFALFSWAVQGATNVLRVLWVLSWILAGMAAVVAYPAALLTGIR